MTDQIFEALYRFGEKFGNRIITEVATEISFRHHWYTDDNILNKEKLSIMCLAIRSNDRDDFLRKCAKCWDIQEEALQQAIKKGWVKEEKEKVN